MYISLTLHNFSYETHDLTPKLYVKTKKGNFNKFRIQCGKWHINIVICSIPAEKHAKCDSWLKSLNIFIFDILFKMS